MRKSDKKMDNLLRATLTEVCESTLKEDIGFQWITHLVNYDDFDKSLKIVCIFDTKDNLSKFMSSNLNQKLNLLIQTKLCNAGIIKKNMTAQVSYETES